MKILNKTQFLFFALLAVVAASAGFVLATGRLPGETQAVARSSTAPAEPHILYLAPKQSKQGIFDVSLAQSYGATRAHQANWQAAQAVAQHRPLDAVLFDASLLDSMTAQDQVWLRNQAREGVILVGLGAADRIFGQALGVETLRAKGEGDFVTGRDEYRLVSFLLLGHPEDLQAIESEYNWLEELRGDDVDGPFANLLIKHPMVTHYRGARGQLNTLHDIDIMFWRITETIESNYQKRAEYQAHVNNQGGK